MNVLKIYVKFSSGETEVSYEHFKPDLDEPMTESLFIQSSDDTAKYTWITLLLTLLNNRVDVESIDLKLIYSGTTVKGNDLVNIESLVGGTTNSGEEGALVTIIRNLIMSKPDGAIHADILPSIMHVDLTPKSVALLTLDGDNTLTSFSVFSRDHHIYAYVAEGMADKSWSTSYFGFIKGITEIVESNVTVGGLSPDVLVDDSFNQVLNISNPETLALISENVVVSKVSSGDV